MDASRFDRFAVSVSRAGASRRTVLHRVAGGGLAAALAAVGLGGFTTPEAAAKKKTCVKRCKTQGKKHDWSSKKKKDCKAKCKKGFSITTTNINSLTAGLPVTVCTVGSSTGCAAGSTCVLNEAGLTVCVANSALGICSVSSECATGFCGNIVAGLGVCLPCGYLGSSVCGQTCCAIGLCANPVANLCVLPQH
jgi:hypothetical protein